MFKKYISKFNKISHLLVEILFWLCRCKLFTLSKKKGEIYVLRKLKFLFGEKLKIHKLI
jgi:hypothetical protein